MKKGEKINRWIDLSGLERDVRGKIQWKKSAGQEIKFIYGDIVGMLKILRCDNNTDKVIVFIDGYTDLDGKSICVDQIKTCSLGNILRKSIAETNPELVKYFVNTDDAFKYSAHSGKTVSMICPACGAIKKQIIEDLTDRGFSCPACSDGISWPNKFMYNILRQLNVDFIREVNKSHKGFEWVGGYLYDFYCEICGKKYFIEMDGGFHFMDTFRTYEQSQFVDKIKDELACKHNVEVIRINCNYQGLENRFSFIKDNIANSKLQSLLNLSDLNWEKANQIASNSYVVETAKLWSDGVCDKKLIARKLGISDDAVLKYLRIAAESGLCSYNQEEERKKWRHGVAKRFSKPVMLSKNNIPINVFESASELDRQSLELYGVHFIKQYISAVCRSDKKQAYGYTMKYITREEYEQLLPQFQTIQN